MNNTALSANTFQFLVALYLMLAVIRLHNAYVNLHAVVLIFFCPDYSENVVSAQYTALRINKVLTICSFVSVSACKLFDRRWGRCSCTNYQMKFALSLNPALWNKRRLWRKEGWKEGMIGWLEKCLFWEEKWLYSCTMGIYWRYIENSAKDCRLRKLCRWTATD